MTEGNKRRRKIIDILGQTDKPLSGTDLAAQFHVSRQVIVQDIALLRAENRNILSTNKGYMLFRPETESHFVKEVLAVRHDSEQILDEMLAIVELGGKMLDVSIDHDIYGNILSDLVINTPEDAHDFVRKIKNASSKPLCSLTDNLHYHTIAAPSQKAMDLIKQSLLEKGIL